MASQEESFSNVAAVDIAMIVTIGMTVAVAVENSRRKDISKTII
jgi:hypothetical protein